MICNPGYHETALPLYFVTTDSLPDIMKSCGAPAARFMKEQGFKGKGGQLCLWHDRDGNLAGACYGLERGLETSKLAFELAALQSKLPAKTFQLFDEPGSCEHFALAWYMHGYAIKKTGQNSHKTATVILPGAIDIDEVKALADAIAFGRDLVNKPSNLLGPGELVTEARKLSEAFNAHIEVTEGEALQQNFPLIAAVGQGSPRPPALIDMRWGSAKSPTLTLVGKGIVFDTGGLDIKPSGAMRHMKKDMGGAAAALALARMIMANDLPINLRVLIPTAENACDGASFRPGDVLTSRKGLSVEVGNTDAEGRLVLADALTFATETPTDMIIDFATLTGAARVALGTDIAAFFSHDEALSRTLTDLGKAHFDPLWPLPLWAPYAKGLESDVADLCNITGTGFAGAITAALFLEAFVKPSVSWVHIDLYAWNTVSRPAKPKGGEVGAVRALYAYLKTWCNAS